MQILTIIEDCFKLSLDMLWVHRSCLSLQELVEESLLLRQRPVHNWLENWRAVCLIKILIIQQLLPKMLEKI